MTSHIPLAVLAFASRVPQLGPLPPRPYAWRELSGEWVVVFEDGRKLRFMKARPSEPQASLGHSGDMSRRSIPASTGNSGDMSRRSLAPAPQPAQPSDEPSEAPPSIGHSGDTSRRNLPASTGNSGDTSRRSIPAPERRSRKK